MEANSREKFMNKDKQADTRKKVYEQRHKKADSRLKKTKLMKTEQMMTYGKVSSKDHNV